MYLLRCWQTSVFWFVSNEHRLPRAFAYHDSQWFRRTVPLRRKEAGVGFENQCLGMSSYMYAETCLKISKPSVFEAPTGGIGYQGLKT